MREKFLNQWMDTTSLEEYGNKTSLIIAGLLPYIGRNKNELMGAFGKPAEIEIRIGSIYKGYQQKRIKFDEVWEYVDVKKISMMNDEYYIKSFFFKEGIVVSVGVFIK